MQQLPPFVKNLPRTRIVCTIGPATGNVNRARQLIRAGMSVARLNLSHGSPEDHSEYVAAVREAAKQIGVHVGILADLPGPKYRIGTVHPEQAVKQSGREGIPVNTRDKFVLTAERVHTTSQRGTVWPAVAPTTDPELASSCDEGVELRVDQVAAKNPLHRPPRRPDPIRQSGNCTRQHINPRLFHRRNRRRPRFRRQSRCRFRRSLIYPKSRRSQGRPKVASRRRTQPSIGRKDRNQRSRRQPERDS